MRVCSFCGADIIDDKSAVCPICHESCFVEKEAENSTEHKYMSVPFEIKASDEDEEYYTFKGYASTFGNEDFGGDVVLPGAFRKTLKEMKPRVCYQHSYKDVIGVLTVYQEDEKGLYVEGKLPKAHSEARNVAALLKCKGIDEMSIGFSTIDSEFNADLNIRYLKEVKLYEVSFVTMGMNNRAKVTSVKQAQLAIDSINSIKDVNAFLKEKGLSNTERTGVIAKIKLIAERRKDEVMVVNNLTESVNQLKELMDNLK